MYPFLWLKCCFEVLRYTFLWPNLFRGIKVYFFLAKSFFFFSEPLPSTQNRRDFDHFFCFLQGFSLRILLGHGI